MTSVEPDCCHILVALSAAQASDPVLALRHSILAAAAIVTTFAGCCCPALSGRFYEVGRCPPTQSCPSDDSCDPAAPCNSRHAALASPGLFPHHHFLAKVPAQKHENYINPLAKFHPVPTRPVFHAHPAPPQPLEPATDSHTPGFRKLHGSY